MIRRTSAALLKISLCFIVQKENLIKISLWEMLIRMILPLECSPIGWIVMLIKIFYPIQTRRLHKLLSILYSLWARTQWVLFLDRVFLTIRNIRLHLFYLERNLEFQPATPVSSCQISILNWVDANGKVLLWNKKKWMISIIPTEVKCNSNKYLLSHRYSRRKPSNRRRRK
jgi:hypothetical protein